MTKKCHLRWMPTDLEDHVCLVTLSTRKPQHSARDSVVLFPAREASPHLATPRVETPIDATDVSPRLLDFRSPTACTTNDEQRPCISDPSVVLFDCNNPSTTGHLERECRASPGRLCRRCEGDCTVRGGCGRCVKTVLMCPGGRGARSLCVCVC